MSEIPAQHFSLFKTGHHDQFLEQARLTQSLTIYVLYVFQTIPYNLPATFVKHNLPDPGSIGDHFRFRGFSYIITVLFTTLENPLTGQQVGD